MARATTTIPELDGLRAIAVMVVMASHAGLERYAPGGFGVMIFFVLSGYLITTLMRIEQAETGTVSLRRFYERRVLRILPPLYLTFAFFALLVAAGLVATDGPPTMLGTAGELLLFDNYNALYGAPTAIPFPGIWSLAVEEHFYLVFPPLYVFWLRHRPRTTQLAVCVAIIVLALVLRCWHAATLVDYSQNYRWSHTRMDAILFGAALALYRNPVLDADGWRPSGRAALAACAVLAVSFAVRSEMVRETIRYTVQGAALSVVFAWAMTSRGRVAALLGGAAARRVAALSYTLYLVHTPLYWAFGRLPVPHAAAILLGVVVSVLYALAMRRFVEAPIARLRRRLHRPPAAAIGTLAAG